MKSRHCNSIASVVAILLLSIAGIPDAPASERGEQLYNNHCQYCHDKTVHTRTDSRVTSIESLRAWVVAWSVHNGLFWGNEEVSDITAYLNRSIYHFTD
jgi:hypothetical protein